jgi:hypothetical protein
MRSDVGKFIVSVQMKDILAKTVPTQNLERIRLSGVFVVRGVVSPEFAGKWNDSLMSEMSYYHSADPANLASYDSIYSDSSFPSFGGIQDMFYTRAQFAIHQNPNVRAVKSWANSTFWKNHDTDGNPCMMSGDCSALYCDRWRHRLPNYPVQSGMRPHIDAGGHSRWADEEYVKAYSPLFQDRYREFDPWVAGPRTHTSSVVFRSFQGWVATTSQCPGSGGLMVLPVLKESIACLLMRPFLKDVEPHILCGCDVSHADQIEVCKFYHSFMNQSLVSIGHINAGDMVCLAALCKPISHEISMKPPHFLSFASRSCGTLISFMQWKMMIAHSSTLLTLCTRQHCQCAP